MTCSSLIVALWSAEVEGGGMLKCSLSSGSVKAPAKRWGLCLSCWLEAEALSAAPNMSAIEIAASDRILDPLWSGRA